MKRKLFPIITVGIALLLFLAGCDDRLTGGYVCKKEHVPGHYVGKTYYAETWEVTLSITGAGCSSVQTSKYEVSSLNYASIHLGQMVCVDEHKALFPVPKEDQ